MLDSRLMAAGMCSNLVTGLCSGFQVWDMFPCSGQQFIYVSPIGAEGIPLKEPKLVCGRIS